jgi:hypothetical protein
MNWRCSRRVSLLAASTKPKLLEKMKISTVLKSVAGCAQQALRTGIVSFQ